MQIQILLISIIAIIIRKSYQQNSTSNNPTGINFNKCSPSLGSNFPTKLSDCFQDTSKSDYDCCFIYMKTQKNETLTMCDSQAKIYVGKGNNEIVAGVLKSMNLTLIANTCPSQNSNKCSPNIGIKYPNSTADCFQDTSNSQYDCCFITAKLGTGEDFRMCDLQAKITKATNSEVVKQAFIAVNANLISNTCPSGQEMISLSLTFLFGALIFILF